MSKTTKRKARAATGTSPRRRRNDRAKVEAPPQPSTAPPDAVPPAGEPNAGEAVSTEASGEANEATGEASGEQYTPGVYADRWLVLDLRDLDVQTLARSYARAIRISKPALAEAIAPLAGVNLGRS